MKLKVLVIIQLRINLFAEMVSAVTEKLVLIVTRTAVSVEIWQLLIGVIQIGSVLSGQLVDQMVFR